MRQIVKALDRILEYAGVLAFLGMIFVLGVQIFFRYVLSAPIVWGLPLSLFLFIWAIWIGGTIGIRDQSQIKVELAERFLPHGIKRILMPGISLVSSLFLLLVIYKSFEVVELQSSAIYDTLPFSRAYLFVVVPIVGSVMFIQCIRVFLRQIREYYFSENSR